MTSAQKQASLEKGGFTLVEIMVVVTIVGILASLTIPSIHRIRLDTQATVVARDLQVLGNALQEASFENGAWPPASNYTMPPAIADSVKQSTWDNGPVTGGRYYWYTTGGDYAILIVNSEATTEQVVKIDEVLDDGFTGSGNFTTSGTTLLVYWLERT